jgi:hypothetical protein
MITFQRFRNATFIARLSKKSPSGFLGEMQEKMTSQNAPQSTISQSRGFMKTPQNHPLTILKGFSTVSAAIELPVKSGFRHVLCLTLTLTILTLRLHLELRVTGKNHVSELNT